MNRTSGLRSIGEILDDLVYASYVANRQAAPGIAPRRWAKVYGPEVDAMEERYQRDQQVAA